MSDTHSPPQSDASMTTSYNTRIGLLSDLHCDYSDYETFREELITAVTAIEDANTDHLVVLGDIIEHGKTPQDVVTATENITSLITDTVSIPVTFIRGNHDVVTTTGDAVPDSPLPTTGTVALGNNVTGVYLDTSSPEWPDARGSLGETQVTFLDNALSDAEKAVVFSHHPLYHHSLARDGHFAEHPEAAFCHDKYRAQDVITEHDNVLAVVNGHTHITDYTEYNTTPSFTVNAFNNEKPGHESVNGSFELLDVSRTQVKRVKHTHGEFTGTDTIKYPLGTQTVALGGTFGPIHDGHREMFRRAFEIGDVVLGITSDTLATQTRHEPRPIPSFSKRKTALVEELDALADTYDREYEINKLSDPAGGVDENPEITHLIVSPETFSRGESINETRVENGLEPLSIEIVDPLLADDGKRISSTRIVNGEIDEHGNVLTQ